MDTRSITVSELARQDTRRPLTTTYTFVPALRIAGRWLQRAGFTPGATVHIHVQPSRLIITTDDGAPTAPVPAPELGPLFAQQFPATVRARVAHRHAQEE